MTNSKLQLVKTEIAQDFTALVYLLFKRITRIVSDGVWLDPDRVCLLKKFLNRLFVQHTQCLDKFSSFRTKTGTILFLSFSIVIGHRLCDVFSLSGFFYTRKLNVPI